MKKKLFFTSVLFLSVASLCYTQSTNCDSVSKSLVNELCIYVDWRASDDDENSPYDFKFQETLSKLAGVSKNDDELVAISKIQKFWNKYKNCLKCSRTNFILSEGNVLFYGAQNGFESFIYLLVSKYKVDINFKDPVHNITVADFIKREFERIKKSNPNDSNGKALEKTYNYLRKLGALHSSELTVQN